MDSKPYIGRLKRKIKRKKKKKRSTKLLKRKLRLHHLQKRKPKSPMLPADNASLFKCRCKLSSS
jgi:hypothetical protein